LLEVLDPEQNATFRDHYLGLPFDLSRVMFIATANVVDTIPAPLRDRMEVIDLPGYTLEEKLQIAQRYLVWRQCEACGLDPTRCELSAEALRTLAHRYTREAGVRQLEREIGRVLRHAALLVAQQLDRAVPASATAPVIEAAVGSGAGSGAGLGSDSVGSAHGEAPVARAGAVTAVVTAAVGGAGADASDSAKASGASGASRASSVSGTAVGSDAVRAGAGGTPAAVSTAHIPAVKIEASELEPVLGPAPFEPESALHAGMPGVATGLAWTPVGGDILFIEASRVGGQDRLILTGQLGDVMKESAQAALTLVKSQALTLGIPQQAFEKVDIHLHVPAGAIPKDGPSAGVAMFIALASLFGDRAVRPDVAMTGEISLRGLVLPVGGVKEKVLAALRAGVRTVLLPARNRKDLVDVPDDARAQLEFVYLDKVDDALVAALGERRQRSAQPLLA
jgi:ATP-dependent Lon protease